MPLITAITAALLLCQQVPAPTVAGLTAVAPTPSAPTPPTQTQSDNYVLGPGDQLLIRALDLQEIDDKPTLIDRHGNISLPDVGQLRAAGLTADQLEAALRLHLSKILVHPDVSVSVVEVHSQGVSVLGAVTTPGVHQLQGDKTLFEVLSLAGGLRPDAGYTVVITRQMEWGAIPLPTAAPDVTGRFSVASVSVRSIMGGSNPAENIHIKPSDVITVPRADIIYVIGAVNKAGGFALNDNGTRSTLQILSLAEGLSKTSAPQRARIMRAVPGSNDRDEIPIDLKKILAGKASDVQLKADDILFVPNSGAKTVGYRTLDIMTASATSLIYRIP